MKSLISFFIAIIFLSSPLFAQKIDQQFFTKANSFFAKEVENGLLDYSSLKSNSELKSLIAIVENADLSSTDDATKKAFYINAYNLHVINQGVDGYPIQSVQDIAGFFDRKKVKVAGDQTTLNNLEKQKLLKPYKDGRLHFVLVCGALGCPPITDFAYLPEKLDMQLDQQTSLALNNPNFIRVEGNKTGLSQIFKWYTGDFGGSTKSVISFINKYRSSPIAENTKTSYYDYDWALNEIKTNTNQTGTAQGNNASRYIVSSTIPKGSVEVKIFNNLYTQRTVQNDALTDRNTFFTTNY